MDFGSFCYLNIPCLKINITLIRMSSSSEEFTHLQENSTTDVFVGIRRLLPTWRFRKPGFHICRENPRRQGILLFPDCPRFCRLMKTRNRRYPRSSGMDGDKSGESGAFLFSRRVPDFCDGRRSFPTIENSNLYRRRRRRWISLITNPPNCWAPVLLSRKFQFLAHIPFPAKFIGRIRDRIVAIIRYIWDGRQKVKSLIVWDFPNILKVL